MQVQPGVSTGTSTYVVHSCDGCRDAVVKPCDFYFDQHHRFECFDHYGHPTGEQACECGALRHHPDQRHADGHLAGHRAYLEDGGECWCSSPAAPLPSAGGERP